MSVLSAAFRKARTLTTFSLFELSLLVPIVVLLGLAGLAIRFMSFRTYASYFGNPTALNTQSAPLDSAELERAKSIGLVVRSAARVTPWDSLCLAQALVATFLMRLFNLPYCVLFGLAKLPDAPDAHPINAHAWVQAGEDTLTGGSRLDQYTVVQAFKKARR